MKLTLNENETLFNLGFLVEPSRDYEVTFCVSPSWIRSILLRTLIPSRSRTVSFNKYALSHRKKFLLIGWTTTTSTNDYLRSDSSPVMCFASISIRSMRMPCRKTHIHCVVSDGLDELCRWMPSRYIRIAWNVPIERVHSTYGVRIPKHDLWNNRFAWIITRRRRPLRSRTIRMNVEPVIFSRTTLVVRWQSVCSLLQHRISIYVGTHHFRSLMRTTKQSCGWTMLLVFFNVVVVVIRR